MDSVKEAIIMLENIGYLVLDMPETETLKELLNDEFKEETTELIQKIWRD